MKSFKIQLKDVSVFLEPLIKFTNVLKLFLNN